jgi:CubicO group peptidase (beta-lactamase class C family)
MRMTRILTVAISVLLLLGGCASASFTAVASDEARGLELLDENTRHPGVDNLSDAEIQTLLQDNVRRDGQADGLVVGIVDASGPRVIFAGTTGGPNARPVDGNTLFRIGSITKVFTAILLQDMVDRGEMNLDDPVQQYLPASVRLPTRNGKAITLFDLATHTSGLPRDWSGLGPSPWTIEGRYEALSRYRLPREPGGEYEYSNMGVALLAHVIALKMGTDYESLIKQRICEPLGMSSTGITIVPSRAGNVATGHAFPGRPVADPGPSLFPGAGEIRTTANDLLKFLAANLELVPSSITPLLQRLHAVQQTPSGRTGRLVWEEQDGVIQHGGVVSGFRSNLGFDPGRRRGVVILANCATSRMPPALLPLLLANRSARPPQTVTLDELDLEKFVGVYRFPGKTSLFVRREGSRLLFQSWQGEPRIRCGTVESPFMVKS